MSQTIVPPHPLVTLRRQVAQLWDSPDSRSVVIGVLGVIFVHLLLLLLAPVMMRPDPAESVIRPQSINRQFNIEIAPETFPPERTKPKPPPAPTKFVETNPNAPDNVPDTTQNFSSRNQQVAQQKPTPNGESDRPALEGQKDIESTRIVDGRLSKQLDENQPEPQNLSKPTQSTLTAPREAQSPLAGIEKQMGDNEAGYGSNVAKFPENQKPIDERVEGQKNAPLIQGATSSEPRIDPRRPQPRPQLVRTVKTGPAIFQENRFGTKNIGEIAYSAKFSQYGLYLQKMFDTIEIQWNQILDTNSFTIRNKSVKVVFQLNKEGKIAKIVSVDGNAGNFGESACTTAITSRAPYGEWTPDMIAALDTTEEIAITFYYR